MPVPEIACRVRDRELSLGRRCSWASVIDSASGSINVTGECVQRGARRLPPGIRQSPPPLGVSGHRAKKEPALSRGLRLAHGAGGIRTLDRALQPYNGLANRRLQPLGHHSQAGILSGRQVYSREGRCGTGVRAANGQGGIRTHETREGLPVFKTGAFNHSATCPYARRYKRRHPCLAQKSHALHALATPSEL